MELDALQATLRITALVRDRAGQRLTGAPVQWTSHDPGIVTVSPEGILTAHANGIATVSAQVGEASGTATVRVRQIPRQVAPVSGMDQRAPAGEELPEPIQVRALDRLGHPVAGTEVRFDAALGGSASPARTETDEEGVAATDWNLGPEPGTQSLAVTVGERHTFHLLASAEDESGRVPFRIRYEFITPPDPVLEDAFQAAAARWEPLIREKLPPVLVRVGEGRCGANAPALNEVVDDLLVLVTEGPIDGPGGIAALANPCFLREGGLLPIVGQVRVDEADVGTLEELGILDDIVTHEVGHVLGFGALWELFDLLRLPSLPDRRGVDTHFAGPLAVDAFDAVGGSDYVGTRVPVENELGEEGTRDRHWRQSVFGNELMTGFLSVARPNLLSRVTLASLADLGYRVDLEGADPFYLDRAPGAPMPDETLFPLHHLPVATFPRLLGSHEALLEPTGR
jgi:hypothetical protein